MEDIGNSSMENGPFLKQTINLASVIAIEILMVMILGLVRIRIKDKYAEGFWCYEF